jgi:hypothetical protein
LLVLEEDLFRGPVSRTCFEAFVDPALLLESGRSAEVTLTGADLSRRVDVLPLMKNKTGKTVPPWREGHAERLFKIRLHQWEGCALIAAAVGFLSMLGYDIKTGEVSLLEVPVTLIVSVALCGFIYFGAVLLTGAHAAGKPFRRVDAMWRGHVGFETATADDVHLLSHVGGILWNHTPTGNEVGWPESHTIVEAWAGEAIPVLTPPTVVRWLLTGEDVALLVEATRRGMSDADLLGYLDGDEQARNAFRFLVAMSMPSSSTSLSITPDTPLLLAG